MDVLVGIVNTFGKRRNEEDLVDRMNFQITPYVLIFFNILITTNTYISKAITCWVPAEFRGGWDEYARDFCLIENTYYVQMNVSEMPDKNIRKTEQLPYYQWVQFVLVLMAFCFYLPHLLWRSTNWRTGVQVRAIVDESVKLFDEEKKEQVEKIADHLYRCTVYKEEKSQQKGTWVAISYVMTKVFFLVNIVLQLIVLHIFLGFHWNDFFRLSVGFDSKWQSTGLFPRSTMCDFSIRNKGNLQRYSVQCVLALNMFNEKIFLVIFYWLLALLTMTLLNTFSWVIFFWTKGDDYEKKMIHAAGVPETQQKQIESFKEDSSSDLLLVLRLISSNAGAAVCSQITKHTYYRYVNGKETWKTK